MGIETEHGLSDQRLRTLFNPTDVHVAVLDRDWKFAVLKRGAHRQELGSRHLAFEYKRFGPPADSGIQRTHKDLIVLPRR